MKKFMTAALATMVILSTPAKASDLFGDFTTIVNDRMLRLEMASLGIKHVTSIEPYVVAACGPNSPATYKLSVIAPNRESPNCILYVGVGPEDGQCFGNGKRVASSVAEDNLKCEAHGQ